MSRPVPPLDERALALRGVERARGSLVRAAARLQRAATEYAYAFHRLSPGDPVLFSTPSAPARVYRGNIESFYLIDRGLPEDTLCARVQILRDDGTTGATMGFMVASIISGRIKP